MKYGLIGEKLGHSFSKQIHESLAEANYTYELKELNKEELPLLFQTGFDAINVTIPYKQMVLPYLDEIEDKAKRIGSVNTIVNRNGLYCGFNTDYAGFSYILKQHHFEVKGKSVLILGSGGTSKTVQAVMEDNHVGIIHIVSRNKTENTITYDELHQYYDVDYIINTTPVGMYPNVNDIALDLTPFTCLKGVIDVIYNPLLTSLLIQAKDKGIAYANGLEMLVAQAKFASELFMNKKISDSKIEDIYQSLLHDMVNIVLIGMPSSGKTSIGKQLSSKFNKKYIDIDECIVEQENKPIPVIFQEHGETYFRKVETELVIKIAKEKKQVIATGGGVIMNDLNMKALHQNGIVIFLDRDIENLTPGEGRPLSKTKDMLIKMHRERYCRYLQVCDKQIDNNNSIEKGIQAIQEVLHEVICNKWS